GGGWGAGERRVRERGLFAVVERGAEGGAGGVAPAGRAADVERGVVGVLGDDAADAREENRVIVAQADEVEQQLGIVRPDDLAVVIGPLAANGLGTEAGGAAAREHEEYAGHREVSATPGGLRADGECRG